MKSRSFPSVLDMVCLAAMLGGVLSYLADSQPVEYTRPVTEVLQPSQEVKEKFWAKSVVWSDYSASVLRQAADARKLVLVQFTQPGCVPCKQCEETIQKEVVSEAVNGVFVTVKLDTESTWMDSGKLVGEVWKVRTVPRTMVVHPSTGAILFDGPSPATEQEWLAFTKRW
jgi:thioredoxin-like negative regulator of GroEL